VTKEQQRISDLEASNRQLRGALIFAARRIHKLNFGKRDDASMPILRRVLREARLVAKENSSSCLDY
jgi:hypothetical protein